MFVATSMVFQHGLQPAPHVWPAPQALGVMMPATGWCVDMSFHKGSLEADLRPYVLEVSQE